MIGPMAVDPQSVEPQSVDPQSVDPQSAQTQPPEIDHPEHPNIGYTVADGVATVLLDRPERLNAMSHDMQVGYLQTLRRAEADPDCRVVVVTGAGRGFCAGADLNQLAEGTATLRSFVPDPELPVDLGLRIRKPVVVGVNGAAAGIGFAFLLASDVRLMAAGARISSTFAGLGLVAEYGTSWLLPRLVGLGAATELLLSARVLDAAEAHRIGLVHEVVPDEELPARLHAYAADLAARCSPRSFAAMKAQLLADQHGPLHEAVDRSRELMLNSFEWPDLPEALTARAERRPPRFGPLEP